MNTKKVILNKCYGGFSLSKKAYELYGKKKGFEVFAYKMEMTPEEVGLERKHIRYIKVDDDTSWFTFYTNKDLGEVVRSIEGSNFILDEDNREDPILIEVVEELGKEANSMLSDLVVVEIPFDLDYTIDNYDGVEILHQKVQEW